MSESKHMPNLDRLSVITALILLVYATMTFMTFPEKDFALQLPGFLLQINFSYISIVGLFVAVLAAAGSDWLVSSHPFFQEKFRWHHWLVPAFSAIAISLPLGKLPIGPAWWFVFGLGGAFLAGVLSAEYISVDSADGRYSFAVLSLNAVSYALFLIIVSAILGANQRFYILLVALIPTVFLVTARSMFLQLSEWKLGWSSGITLVIAQLSAGLFYLPLKPLQFSLILLGLLYALIALAVNVEERHSRETRWIEPVLMFGIFTMIGFIVS